MNLRSVHVFTFSLLLAFAISGQSVRAQTYYVGTNGNNTRTNAQAQNRNTPFLSIQTALNRARSGSTIVVLDGTYWGNFDFVRSSVTLKAERKEGAFIVGSIHASDLSFIKVDGFELRRL